VRQHGFGAPATTPGLLDQNQQAYASQVAKALQLQGSIPGKLDPRIQLGINVDDLSARQFWHLRRGTSWQNFRDVTAVVGQRGFVQVLGSVGMIAKLEKVVVTNNAGGSLTFTYGLAAFEAAAGGGGVASCDDRAWSAVSPATVVTFGAAVAPLYSPGGWMIVPTGTSVDVPLGEGIILTGKANSAGVVPVWKLTANAANVAFQVTTFHSEHKR